MKHRKLVLRLLICVALLEPGAHLVTTLIDVVTPPTLVNSYRLHFADGYWEPDDYASPNLNIRDGERRTIGQPTQAARTIWIYGQSIMFGFRIADGDTVASRLQALMPAYRVVNHSAIGQSFRGEFAWLRADPIKAGDVVIFGGSSNDITFIDHKAKPVAGWIWSECDLPVKARSVITIFAVVCLVVPSLPSDPAVYQYYLDDYRQTIQESRAYIQQRGLTPIYLSELPLTIPGSGYADNAGHYNRQGASIVARAIYDRLTIF